MAFAAEKALQRINQSMKLKLCFEAIAHYNHCDNTEVRISTLRVPNHGRSNSIPLNGWM